MSSLQLLTRRLRIAACGVVLGAALAACGHSNSAPPAPAPSPVAQFINFVMNVVNGGAADTDEPTDIGGVTAATTETDEPVTL